MIQNNSSLPHELADWFTEPFVRFLRVEAAAGALLLVATVTALLLSNSAWSAPFLAFWETPVGMHFGSLDFSRPLRHWINDGLMTLFFFMIALELKRELTLGELQTARMAALPFAGALGGMLVPAALYLTLMIGEPGMHGWGAVMATDTAFVIGCLALFGSRIPSSLRLFLLSLAVFDDVGAIAVVSFVYGNDLNWLALVLGLFSLALIAGVARIGFRSIPIFFLLGGLSWTCFDASGIHPTIAGVILGLMTPTHGWVSDARLRVIFGRVLSYPVGDNWSGDTAERRDLRRAGTAASETLSPIERLEMMLHPWVGFAIMPIFAIANAGVSLSSADFGQSVSVAILAGLVFGKPIGVLSFSWLAVRTGLATRPLGLSWAILAAGSFLTGIGFTMSLFIAGLAYAPAMLSTAKIGILTGSAVSAAAGLIMLSMLTFGKRIV